MKTSIDWKNSNVLVTGGTGSFGKHFLKVLLEGYGPRRIVVLSRDELKQHEMRIGGYDHPSLRYFIGDVRDVDRLRRAMKGVDIVVHAAALKQVPACEYNPMEAVQTNVNGAKNVIDAALDCGVTRVIALSTDKAVSPTNLYGATKLVAEKLFVQANAYSGGSDTAFSCVRYGNVVASRGSVIPLFLDQRKNGFLTVTDPRMTRFWITLEAGVRFVIRSLELMHGGEIFVPKIPSTSIMDVAQAIAPDHEVRVTGIRPGEKLHEVLLSEEESRHGVELDDMFVILPSHPFWKSTGWSTARRLTEAMRYSSDSNSHWLDAEGIRQLVKQTTKEQTDYAWLNPPAGTEIPAVRPSGD